MASAKVSMIQAISSKKKAAEQGDIRGRTRS
jgi:hypothetical protein